MDARLELDTDEEKAVVQNLLDLPDDVMLVVARSILMDTPTPFGCDDQEHAICAALRFSATCSALRVRTEPVRRKLQDVRLRWLAELTPDCTISCHGRTIAAPSYRWRAQRGHGAAGSLLPAQGCFRWSVRIDRCFENLGRMHIGVCNAESTCGWGLYGYFGTLSRWCYMHGEGRGEVDLDAPPPDGFPDGDGLRIFVESWIKGRAEGTKIHCVFDADRGELYFCLGGTANGGDHWPLTRSRNTIRGFPRGCRVRPWVWLYNESDTVTLSAICVQHQPAARFVAPRESCDTVDPRQE